MKVVEEAVARNRPPLKLKVATPAAALAVV